MTGPTSSYLICSTPRSGTTLLCETLAATGVAGRPQGTVAPPTGAEFNDPDQLSAEEPTHIAAPHLSGTAVEGSSPATGQEEA